MAIPVEKAKSIGTEVEDIVPVGPTTAFMFAASTKATPLAAPLAANVSVPTPSPFCTGAGDAAVPLDAC